ncbi:hypothetical protein FRC17_001267 [Serendipita sp. 399]|nr:hypothetical protein FRC17_001267 [Serendipita sp. 399]
MFWDGRKISWKWRAVVMCMVLHVVNAARNVTVDDTDPMITYIGSWQTTSNSRSYGRTYHYSNKDASSASFTFTGATQVHFMGLGMTNGDIDTDIRIVFDQRITTVDIWRDEGEQYQAILWSSGVLDPSSTHTIVAQKISDDGGGRDLYIDAFVMTVPDTVPLQQSGSSIPSSSGASSTSPSSSAGSTSISSTQANPSGNATSQTSTTVWNPLMGSIDSNTLSFNTLSAPEATDPSSANIASSDRKTIPTAAIVGGVLGVLAFVSIIAAVFFWLGRRRRVQTETEGTSPVEPGWNDSTYPATVNSGGTDGSTMNLSMFSTPVLGAKGAAARREFSEGSMILSSPISEDPTSPRMMNRTSAHPPADQQSHVSESRTWMMVNPPAYTPRPISGHVYADGETVSESASSRGDTSSPYTQRLGRVKEEGSLLN